MRVRRDVRAAKEVGRCVGGGDRGRKPFCKETVKGEMAESSFESEGMMSRRGKVGEGVIGLILLG